MPTYNIRKAITYKPVVGHLWKRGVVVQLITSVTPKYVYWEGRRGLMETKGKTEINRFMLRFEETEVWIPAPRRARPARYEFEEYRPTLLFNQKE